MSHISNFFVSWSKMCELRNLPQNCISGIFFIAQVLILQVNKILGEGYSSYLWRKCVNCLKSHLISTYLRWISSNRDQMKTGPVKLCKIVGRIQFSDQRFPVWYFWLNIKQMWLFHGFWYGLYNWFKNQKSK